MTRVIISIVTFKFFFPPLRLTTTTVRSLYVLDLYNRNRAYFYSAVLESGTAFENYRSCRQRSRVERKAGGSKLSATSCGFCALCVYVCVYVSRKCAGKRRFSEETAIISFRVHFRLVSFLLVMAHEFFTLSFHATDKTNSNLTFSWKQGEGEGERGGGRDAIEKDCFFSFSISFSKSRFERINGVR